VAKRLPPELLFALLDRHAAVVADSNVVPVVGEGHLTSIRSAVGAVVKICSKASESITSKSGGLTSSRAEARGFLLILRKFERVNVFYFSYFVNYLINNVIDV